MNTPPPLAHPIQTPHQVNEVTAQLRAALVADDMDAFRALLAGLGPEPSRRVLYRLMCAALTHDNARAVSEMLRRDPLPSFNVEVAIAARAKQCLALYMERGWDVNDVGKAHHLPSAFM